MCLSTDITIRATTSFDIYQHQHFNNQEHKLSITESSAQYFNQHFAPTVTRKVYSAPAAGWQVWISEGWI